MGAATIQHLVRASEHEVYPAAGGILDQSAAFVQAVAVVAEEIAAVRRERAKS